MRASERHARERGEEALRKPVQSSVVMDHSEAPKRNPATGRGALACRRSRDVTQTANLQRGDKPAVTDCGYVALTTLKKCWPPWKSA